MKRIIIATLLLISVIVIYASTVAFITNSCEQTKSLVEKAVSSYQQDKNARKETEKLKKYWDKEEKMLSAFVNHDHIDEIELSISSLNIYAQNGDDKMFYMYADSIKTLIHQVLEDTKITPSSIF